MNQFRNSSNHKLTLLSYGWTIPRSTVSCLSEPSSSSLFRLSIWPIHQGTNVCYRNQWSIIVIQLAYWLHSFPEFYLQKYKGEEMKERTTPILIHIVAITAGYVLKWVERKREDNGWSILYSVSIVLLSFFSLWKHSLDSSSILLVSSISSNARTSLTNCESSSPPSPPFLSHCPLVYSFFTVDSQISFVHHV